MYVHVCGTRERETTGGEVAKWPQSEVTYFEDLAFIGLTREQVATCYDKAASLWEAAAGITLRAGLGAVDGEYRGS